MIFILTPITLLFFILVFWWQFICSAEAYRQRVWLIRFIPVDDNFPRNIAKFRKVSIDIHMLRLMFGMNPWKLYNDIKIDVNTLEP